MASVRIKEELEDFEESTNKPTLYKSGGRWITAPTTTTSTVSNNSLQENTNKAPLLKLRVVSKEKLTGAPVASTNNVLKAALTTQLETVDNSSENNKFQCGEIFVANNAKKWTFVCTFCQKSTRDIGEFICHIKFKHIGGTFDDDDMQMDDTIISDYNKTAEDDTFQQEQDYMDCASYLDVNVHTDPDELSLCNGTASSRLDLQNSKPMQINKQAEPLQLTRVYPQPAKRLYQSLPDNELAINQQPTTTTAALTNNTINYNYDDDEEFQEGAEISDDDDNNDAADIDEDEEHMDGDEDADDFLLKDENDDDDSLLCLRSPPSYDSEQYANKYRKHIKGKAYCELCNKTFNYYSLYRNHMTKHSNLTPHKCSYCTKAFKSKQALGYHMKGHTKKQPHVCAVCKHSFISENRFLTHIASHESDTCFPCMVCGIVMKSEQARDQHMEMHSEERPHHCTVCNKRFRRKHHLSNHLKLHCQYRCHFCKNVFVSTQTQRPPYACLSCENKPDVRVTVEQQRSLRTRGSTGAANRSNLSIANKNSTADCIELPDSDDGEESDDANGSDVSGFDPLRFKK